MAIRKVISRSIEDNTVAAADFQGAVTSLSNAGNLTFSSTGQRITGDMSNSTLSNRVAFQTSTTNAGTVLTAIPNGTSALSQIQFYSNSDPTNSSRLTVFNNNTTCSVNADISGTGTYLPLTMLTGGSERLRISTAGLVGIGTVSATNTLQVAGGISATSSAPAFQASAAIMDVSAGVARFNATGADNSTNGVMTFNTASANAGVFNERMRITSAGRVCIGTSEANTRLNVYDSVATTASSTSFWNATFTGINMRNTSDVTNTLCGISFGGGSSGNSISAIANITETLSLGALAFYTGGQGVSNSVPERMRIDSSGRVQIGTTANSPASADTYGIVLGVDGAGSAYAGSSQFSSNGTAGIVLNRGGDNGTTLAFKRSGTTVGGVNVTTTATSYGTSSDYRLKENITPMTGALAVVGQLKPCTYTWKADGSDGQGFIAHELAEVVPDAVTGEKDAVDADGNPEYQGIDTSFLVATLTAAIQELKAENDALKQRLDAAGL